MYKRNDSGLAVLLRSCPILVTLLAGGLVFLMILGFKGCSKKDSAAPEPAVASGPITPVTGAIAPATEAPSADASTTDAPADTQDAETQTSDSAPVETETPETTEPVTTEAPEPEYPAGFTTVDESYFSDALFIGDSRTNGLEIYCPVGDATYYCGTSMTIYKVMDSTETVSGYYGLRALLQGKQFGKIYIMFGINEAGYDTDSWAAKYRDVVQEIRNNQPNAIIYIQSILYVTQNHEAKNPVFSTAGLKEKNAKLMEMANGVDIFYLEVNDCLNDGTDHLPSEYTGDGVHLKSSYYYLWKDYLIAHAIVNAAHPWPVTE